VQIPPSEGVFTMTVSDPPVEFNTAVLNDGKTFLESTGQLGTVTIGDSRFQGRPGWSVSGQVGDFNRGNDRFNDGFLGWVPAVTTQNSAHDVLAGPLVMPGADPGLKGGSELAHATPTHGLGTTVLGANLTLQMPAGAAPTAYSPTLTVTALDAG